ncbi:MAG: ATP-binding cassette domain-containing protein [Lachnospiraceae bacterium]|nr:ATP-binding cassette domain-containing protein [Lachnospiraceae bacterium]
MCFLPIALFSAHRGILAKYFRSSAIGKSTLLSLLAGLIEPEHGSILLYGQKLLQKAGGTIGYMLQHDHLLEWRTIEKNVLLGLEIQNKLTPAAREKTLDMLKTYGLYKFKDARPSQLSGGMRQRAALIRTLALEPEILLLDEPFSALDYQTRLTVGDDIGMIIKKEQKTAVLVTHDLSEAVSLGSQVIILSKRPATVNRIVDISFPENASPLERRNLPEFKDYFNEIWKELNEDE